MRFPYTVADPTYYPTTSFMPRLPLTLHYGERSVDVVGLLDTGAAVNVLPYAVGLSLGAVWENQPLLEPLAGNLREVEVRGLPVFASHAQLTGDIPVRLVFAWAHTDNAPIIFGQMNFFLEFDVCFYRSQNVFDVTRKRR